MNSYDVAVIGNGIIGTLTAIKVAESGISVAMVGPASRPGSASMAAGAMLNVLGEVDGALDDYMRRKIDIGTRAIGLWRSILSPSIFVADRTEIYRMHGRSEFEARCFDAIVTASGGVVRREQDRDIVALENEPAVSTPALFSWLDERLAALGVPKLEAPPSAKRIVKCAGAHTAHDGMLPVYFGVGNAMVVSEVEIDIPVRTVVRTPNRGNTCGLHIVPRGRSYYIGAGSYLATAPSDGYRIETLKYLTQCLEDDFGVETWQMAIQPIKGYRPISLDGKPLLGPPAANPDTYIATGTKRDGLTYAPVIAEDILAWLNGGARSVFEGWEPDRKPISYGTRQMAIDAYIANRDTALREHGRTSVTDGARATAIAAHDRVIARYNLPSDFGLHPELVPVV